MGLLESDGGIFFIPFWEKIGLVRQAVKVKMPVLFRDDEH